MLKKDQVVTANWDAPKNISGFTTTRLGGKSVGEFQTLNLGLHVGDDNRRVLENRLQLVETLGRDQRIMWLSQAHTNLIATPDTYLEKTSFDASISTNAKFACAVMTADCLPILLCSQDGSEIAALHCGWQGLYKGLIQKTIQKMNSPAAEVIAWLGPAISANNYEVDELFYQRFYEKNADYKTCFVANRAGHYLCDLYQIARYDLSSVGVLNISGGQFCTFDDPRFYSYRKSKQTGRMATVIYFN